jgi:hypothetical protein
MSFGSGFGAGIGAGLAIGIAVGNSSGGEGAKSTLRRKLAVAIEDRTISVLSPDGHRYNPDEVLELLDSIDLRQRGD